MIKMTMMMIIILKYAFSQCFDQMKIRFYAKKRLKERRKGTFSVVLLLLY